MNYQEQETIRILRTANYSFSFIGKALNIPKDTVKSYCRRHDIRPEGPRKTKAEKENANLCKNCHRPIPDHFRKGTIFCSSTCRRAWQKHADQEKRRNQQQI